MAAQRRRLVESIEVSVPGIASRKPNISSGGGGHCCLVRALIDNRHNFQRTGPPARIMYYGGGSWTDFHGKVVESLRPSFVQRRPVVDLAIDGSRYLFDFFRMLQTDFVSGNQRSIAWMDEAGTCFFPKSFLEELDEGSVKRKRESLGEEEVRGEEDEVNSSKKKPHEDEPKKLRLVPTGDNPEKSSWANTRLLEEGEGAFSRIKNCFCSGLKSTDAGATITAIRQCKWEGDLGRARFEVFQNQAEITKAVRGAPNTVYAWHGASKKNVDSILAHGFSSPGNITQSGSYGVGVYFSSMGLPHLSAMKCEVDDNGEKHVILCRLILGNVEKVESGSKQSHPSSVNFDTGVDDPTNPKWYVVWCSNMNAHVLPEFVVSFKPSQIVKGPAKRAACMKRSVAELFSKMKNALPPAKLQEVENLYSIFRAGQLAKDMFAKQLRSIAGDEVLLSTIREIRGSE